MAENTNELEEENIESSEEDDTSTESIETGLIVTLILIIYIALMMITGGTVYAAHGWQGRGSGPNASIVSKAVGMIVTVVNILKGENTTFHDVIDQTQDSTNLTLIISGVCPVDGVCPAVVGCIENETSCLPQPKVKCIPQVWPTRHICWQPTTPCPPGSCQVPECPTTTAPPPIEDFRTAIIETRPVFEWLNMYPPNSANRLEVITTLMSNTIEQFALNAYFHRCRDRWMDHIEPLYKTICSFCNDRYDYIRCVYSNELVGQVHDDEENYLSPIYWSELGFMHADMVNIIYNDVSTEHLTYIFRRFEKMKRAFAVKTAKGGKCEVCTEYWRSVYDKCYSANSKWYIYPKDFDAQKMTRDSGLVSAEEKKEFSFNITQSLS